MRWAGCVSARAIPLPRAARSKRAGDGCPPAGPAATCSPSCRRWATSGRKPTCAARWQDDSRTRSMGDSMNKGMKRALLLPLLLLAGCETLAPRVDGPADWQAWEARQERLSVLDHWRLEGRVAIAVSDEGWNANL